MAHVHYEVFRQTGRSGGWSLVEAVEDREVALRRAKELFSEGRAAAVKVVKETLQPSTGDYMSLTIFEEAHANFRQQKKQGAEDEPKNPLPCFQPDDLYSYHARMTIARLVSDWLSRQRLTVTELIHSAAALEKFEATGTTYQHAIQKIAVAEAAAGGVPVQQIIKQLNSLCSKAIARVYKDERRGAFVLLQAGEFAAYAEKIATDPQCEYYLRAALAKYLAGTMGWDEKLQRTLALIPGIPAEGPTRPVLLGLVDSYVAELLNGAAALADLLGPNPNLGQALLNLVQLFLGEPVHTSEGGNTGLNQLAPYLAKDELPNARAAVAGRIVSELTAMKRLCPSSLDDELKMMRKLANKLVVGQGKYLSHDDLIAAFTERSKRLVVHETLSTYLQYVVTPDAKVERLLTVEENIVGAENKRKLAGYILPIVKSGDFEELLCPQQPVIQRLQRLVALQDRVLRSGLQDFQKAQISDALDQIACGIEKRANFLAGMDAKLVSPDEKMQFIMKLCGSRVFTEGELSRRARRCLLSAVGTREFLAGYFAQRQNGDGGIDRVQVVRELIGELERVGIAPEEGLAAIAA